MLTNQEENRINDDMYKTDPREAWINDMACTLAEIPADERAWEPTDLIGKTMKVVIPNGLTGAQRRERHVEITVTTDMVVAASSAANRILFEQARKRELNA